MSPELTIGPVRVAPRAPAVLWDGDSAMVVTRTGTLGFSGAPEADRIRWITSFRRLLDGLDAPLQVVIEVEPGTDSYDPDLQLQPTETAEARSADISFVERISRSPTAHRCSVLMVTTEAQSARLETALREMGIASTSSAATTAAIFGTEQPSHFLHSAGWSRTWYVERLPGSELEAGWLHRLLPRGLRLTLSWHATPLPVAWVVEYLQRQLVGMRATRLQELNTGTADPALAGALPNAEDLQRRLAASQEKAFHVSIYLTLTSPTRDMLEAGARRIEAAARTLLCRLSPCTFRMFDAYLATRPAAVDRLQRNRVLDTSSLETFFPWLDADLHQPGGLVIGRSQATGLPVVVDLFDQRSYANAKAFMQGYDTARPSSDRVWRAPA